MALQANSGFPSSHKSARAAKRQLADRVLEVQDYGGTQEVAIQQGDTTTVIQQDPGSSHPKLAVHDSDGVHTASKYKPLDTPGISVSKGGIHNTNTVVEVGEGDTKQTIELLRKPGTLADKASAVTDKAAATANSTQAKAGVNQATGLGAVTAKPGAGSTASSTTSDKPKSSFHGGGTTQDSAASSNITERASQDQKQAMAATDRQKSSSAAEVSSSSSDEAHPKDPASLQADTGFSGPLSSVGLAAAAVASSVKSLVFNNTQVLSTTPVMVFREPCTSANEPPYVGYPWPVVIKSISVPC